MEKQKVLKMLMECVSFELGQEEVSRINHLWESARISESSGKILELMYQLRFNKIAKKSFFEALSYL